MTDESTSKTKIFLAGCALTVIAVAGGYFYARVSTHPETIKTTSLALAKEKSEVKVAVEKVKEDIKENKKTITKEKITTKEDGTRVEEREIVEDKMTDTGRDELKVSEEKAEEKLVVHEETKEVVKIYRPNYSLGLKATKKLEDIVTTLPKDKLDFQAEVGVRLFGPVWGTGSYEFGSKRIGIGVRVEF